MHAVNGLGSLICYLYTIKYLLCDRRDASDSKIRVVNKVDMIFAFTEPTVLGGR